MTQFNLVRLTKGFPVPAGDPDSSEPGILESIDLLSNTISLKGDNGWIPAIAQPKGGAWVDNNQEVGRVLQSITDQNVTETLIISIVGDTVQATAQEMRRLQRLAQDAREQWTTEWQTNPVYIERWDAGAPDAQYAKIYNIEITEKLPVDPPTNREVTIRLEREPYWLPVRPGTSPKSWEFYRRNWVPGVNYTFEDLDLFGTADQNDFYNAPADTIFGMSAFTINTSYTEQQRVNYIDIDAADLPGDAPTLLRIDYQIAEGGSSPDVYIARSTKPRTFDYRVIGGTPGVTEYPHYNTLAAGDSLTAYTKGTATCGIPSNNSNSAYAVTGSVAGNQDPTIDDNTDMYWYFNTTAPVFINQFRGRWLIFVNAGQTSGAVGDLDMRLVAGILDGYVATPYAPMPFNSGATASCNEHFPLTYLGELEIPFNSNIFSDNRGLGISVLPLQLALQFRNNTGTGKTIEVSSVVLIPVDEAAIVIKSPDTNTSTQVYGTYDNTGYSDHGRGEALAFSNYMPVEVLGRDLTLKPGVNNRLYFFMSFTGAGAAADYDVAIAAAKMTNLRLNIIPRWRGVRDV